MHDKLLKEIEREERRSGLKPIVNEKLSKEVWLVAANKTQAKLWAREQGFRTSQWKYAAGDAAINAVKNSEKVEVVFVPGWETRDDFRSLSDAVVGAVAKVIAA